MSRVGEVYQGLNAPDFDAPPELEGNSLVQVHLVTQVCSMALRVGA